MTKEEVLSALRGLDQEQEFRWLMDLGSGLTIAARSGYPLNGEPGRIEHLIAFNEMQHRVYGRLRHLHPGDAWELQGFLDGLQGLAVQYQVEGDFGFAVAASIRQLSNSHV